MFSNPRHNVEQFGLSDHMIVADFGAGSGFYSIEAAKAVMPHGKVYAMDVQKGLLERLKNQAHTLRIQNLDIIAGDLERAGGSGIKDSLCDAVIVSNILFMIENKKGFIEEVRRILKSKGRMLLIDWSASFSHTGPHPDHVVYKDDAVKLVTSLGFAFDRDIDAGEHHYGMIFRKQ